MITVSWILGGLATVSAAIAAVCAYKAATTKAIPSWERDPELKPKNMQQHLFGMVNALDAQQFWAGRWNAKAAFLWRHCSRPRIGCLATIKLDCTHLRWTAPMSVALSGERETQRWTFWGGWQRCWGVHLTKLLCE